MYETINYISGIKLKKLVSNHKVFDSHSINMNPVRILILDNIDFKIAIS